MMKIDVFGSYINVADKDIVDRDVVVLDIFRTTSVIVTALAHKARCVLPVESIDEAWDIFYKDESGATLLGGERQALPIKGFHLDNSPGAYSEEKVGGKRIVITTSNGSRAIKVCTAAKRVYIASFLNVSQIVRELKERAHDVAVVCSGTFGRFALEDGLCAGMIVSLLSKTGNILITDLGIAMKELFESPTDIRSMLKRGSVAYGYLERTGYEDDIDFCLQRDIYSVVPFYQEGSVTA